MRNRSDSPAFTAANGITTTSALSSTASLAFSLAAFISAPVIILVNSCSPVSTLYALGLEALLLSRTIFHALQSNDLVPEALTLFAAVNLLQTDERLHIFRGNMAGLSEWATSEEVANDALSDLSEIQPSEAENMLLDFDSM
jgi:hypothetical protein